MKDKVIIITGATRGIGLELAKKILAKEAKVSICARDTFGIFDQLQDKNVFIKDCDVSVYEQVKEFVKETYTRFNKIDILINNAAMGIFDKIENYLIDDWAKVINCNLNGVFYMCHQIIPILKNNQTSPKGYILNVGSISYNYLVNESSLYSSSKAAVKTFSDHLYNELRTENMLITYIAAGSVNTSFSKRNQDDINWKIETNDISDIIINILETGYCYPHCCINYLEIKTNSKKIEAYKE